MESNFEVSSAALNVKFEYSNSISYECTFDQKFTYGVAGAKFDFGLTTSISLAPSFEFGKSYLNSSVIKKTDKDVATHSKNCTHYLLYSSCSGIAPAGHNEDNGDKQLLIAAKKDIEFIAGGKIIANKALDMAEKIAPALSSLGQLAAAAVSIAGGNRSITGAAAAVVTSLIPLSAYSNLPGSRDSNPLEQKMDSLQTATSAYDISSYTDGNMNLIYGKNLMAKSDKSCLTADNEKNKIIFDIEQLLKIGVDKNECIKFSNNGILIKSENNKIKITSSEISLAADGMSLKVRNGQVSIGSKISVQKQKNVAGLITLSGGSISFSP